MLRAKIGSTIAVLWCLAAFPSASRAGLVSLCEYQPNIDYECKNCTPKSNSMPIALFNYPNHAQLQDISQISFTASMQVGDPAHSHLTLGIDGIDTGLALTGFQKNSLVEKTFTMKKGDANWLTPGKEAELLNALKDGKAFASLIGAKPDDLHLQLYSDTQVNLCINGEGPTPTPEPASLLGWSFAALAAGLRRRKLA